MLDNYKNFAISTLASGINSSATSLSVTTGQGARFPAVPFNVTIFNSTDYTSAAAAVHAGAGEIVRVTAISTDTFTITRAQEGTTAVNLNTGGKTYTILAGLTAATLAKISGGLLPALNADWKPADTNFVVDGDSIPTGWGDFSSIPALSGKVNFYNVAVSGSWLGNTDGTGSPASGNLFNSSRWNNIFTKRPAANGGTAGINRLIVLLMIGTNNNYDYAGDRLATYIANLKAIGATVYVCTIYATSGFHASGGSVAYTPQAVQWFARYNRSIYDGTAGADYVIPIDRIIWGIGDPAVAGDKLHLTTIGNDRCKALINSVLLSDGTAYNPDANRRQIGATIGGMAGGLMRHDSAFDYPHAWRTSQGPQSQPLTFATDLLWDTSMAQSATVDLTADVTSVTVSNQISGTPYELWVKHNGNDITWAYPIVFAGGISTTYSANAAHTDYYKFACKDSVLVCVEHKIDIPLAPPPTAGVVMEERFMQTGAASPGVALHGTPADTVNIPGKLWNSPSGSGTYNLGVVRKFDANEGYGHGAGCALYNSGLSDNFQLEFTMLNNGGGTWNSGIVIKCANDTSEIGFGTGGANQMIILNLINQSSTDYVQIKHQGGGFDATLFNDAGSPTGIVDGDTCRVSVILGVLRLYRMVSGSPVLKATVTLPPSVATFATHGFKLPDSSGARFTNIKLWNLAP